MSFYELVTAYFLDSTPSFNIDKYIKSRHTDWDESNLSNLSLQDILPETKLITEKEINNATIDDAMCSYERKCLYKYKKYYIVMQFKYNIEMQSVTQDDNTSCLDIKDTFGSLKRFYKKCVRVIRQKNFDYEIFFGPNESDLNFIMRYFIKTNRFGNEGMFRFNEYISRRYDDYDLENSDSESS